MQMGHDEKTLLHSKATMRSRALRFVFKRPRSSPFAANTHSSDDEGCCDPAGRFTTVYGSCVTITDGTHPLTSQR